MASLPPSTDTIILITGINSYIGSNIGLQLLEKGYTVRGTSRSGSAKDRLLSGPFAPYKSQYQHALVPDITAPGAFDTAVRGVHAIIHVASPVDFTLTTLSAYLEPAINGVLSILHSAQTHAGPQLQCFILTSSIAAIADRWTHPFGHPYSYTEADWNTNSLLQAQQSFTAPVAYGASKTEAERALWRFTTSSDSHPPPTFACATINPGVVIGPPILLPSSPAQLNTTLLPIWWLYSNTSPGGVIPPQIGGATWIDVRDVAALHVWAATHPEEARGRRFLATSGKAPPQAVADLLRREFPDRVVLRGEPGSGYVVPQWRDGEGEGRWSGGYGWEPEEEGGQSSDAVRMREVLGGEGWRFHGFEECVLDTVRVLEAAWPGVATNWKEGNEGEVSLR